MTHDDAIRGEALSQITDMGERTRVRLLRAITDLQQIPDRLPRVQDSLRREIAECWAILKRLEAKAS